jgi:hypothetical protein
VGSEVEPGLDGSFRESCIVCMRGTDTGLGVIGEPEWQIAVLVVLGVPTDEAVATWRVFAAELAADPSSGPQDEVHRIRVCRSCADASGSGLQVAPLTGPVPGYRAPPLGWHDTWPRRLRRWRRRT